MGRGDVGARLPGLTVEELLAGPASILAANASRRAITDGSAEGLGPGRCTATGGRRVGGAGRLRKGGGGEGCGVGCNASGGGTGEGVTSALAFPKAV